MSEARKVALIIGVNHAPDSGCSELLYAEETARRLADQLESKACGFTIYGGGPILGQEATTDQVRSAFGALMQAREPITTLLIVFIGHGRWSKIEADRRDVYLVTANFNPAQIDFDENSHLSMRWLQDRVLRRAGPEQILLILDCCYAGAIGEAQPDPYLDELKRRIEQYFNTQTIGDGTTGAAMRKVLAAASATQESYERDGSTVYSGVLLKGIAGDARDEQGMVTWTTLHRHTQRCLPDSGIGEYGFARTDTILARYPELAQSHGGARQPWVMPYAHNVRFVGREAELAYLETLIASEDGREHQGAVVMPALAGVGGIGKTQLAIEFAHRHRHQFPGGVFWLSMENPATIEAQIVACGGTSGLGLFDDDADTQYARQIAERIHYRHRLAAKSPQSSGDKGLGESSLVSELDIEKRLTFGERAARVTQAWEESIRRLVIFDNLEDPALLDLWRPKGGGSFVLITTRNQALSVFGEVDSIPLEPLADAASLTLLLEPRARVRRQTIEDLITAPEEYQAAHDLILLLGNLPLALTLVSAFLAERTISLAAYVAQIREGVVRHASLNPELRQMLPTGHEASIIATFSVSYAQLQPADPTDELAQTIWLAAAQCAPEPIPLELLQRSAGVYNDTDRYGSSRYLRLVAKHQRGIPQELVAESDQPIESHSDPSVKATLEQRPEQPSSDIDTDTLTRTGKMQKLATEADQLIDLVLDDHLNPEDGLSDETTLVLHDVESDLDVSGLDRDEPTDSERFDRAIARLRSLGLIDVVRNHIKVHRLLAAYARDVSSNPVADWQRVARALVEMVKDWRFFSLRQGNDDIREHIRYVILALDDDLSIDRTELLSAAATVAYEEQDYPVARHYLIEVLSIRERVLGHDHPATADILSRLGNVAYEELDYPIARHYYADALAIRERVLGHNDPATGDILSRLGNVALMEQDYPTARKYFTDTLAIREHVHGHDDYQTTTTLYALGNVAFMEEDYRAARRYHMAALGIRERVRGHDHSSTAIILQALGDIAVAEEDYPAARRYYLDTLTIRERDFGHDHRFTASILHDLGHVAFREKDYPAARRYYRDSLIIKEHVLGQDDFQSALTMRELGDIAAEEQHYATAQQYYTETLAIIERMLGRNHQTVALMLYNLGKTTKGMGHYRKARGWFKEALTIEQNVLGKRHSSTKASKSAIREVFVDVFMKAVVLAVWPWVFLPPLIGRITAVMTFAIGLSGYWLWPIARLAHAVWRIVGGFLCGFSVCLILAMTIDIHTVESIMGWVILGGGFLGLCWPWLWQTGPGQAILHHKRRLSYRIHRVISAPSRYIKRKYKHSRIDRRIKGLLWNIKHKDKH